jgi:hypothetical protein
MCYHLIKLGIYDVFKCLDIRAIFYPLGEGSIVENMLNVTPFDSIFFIDDPFSVIVYGS